MLLVAAPAAPATGPLRLLQADAAIPLGTSVLPAIVDHAHDDETTVWFLLLVLLCFFFAFVRACMGMYVHTRVCGHLARMHKRACMLL